MKFGLDAKNLLTRRRKNALFFEIVVVERVLVVGGEQCEHVRGSSRRRRRLMVLVVVEKVRRAREKKGVARAAKNRWSQGISSDVSEVRNGDSAARIPRRPRLHPLYTHTPTYIFSPNTYRRIFYEGFFFGVRRTCILAAPPAGGRLVYGRQGAHELEKNRGFFAFLCSYRCVSHIFRAHLGVGCCRRRPKGPARCARARKMNSFTFCVFYVFWATTRFLQNNGGKNWNKNCM